MLSFIKKMTSLIVTNFSQKFSDLKNFNFEVILRYYNLDLDNNLYFQNFHRKTKISTLESLTYVDDNLFGVINQSSSSASKIAHMRGCQGW